MPIPPPNEPPRPPQGQGPAPTRNWGALLLLVALAAIAILAFSSNSSATPPQDNSLAAFRKDFRNGLIVVNDKKNFPIEVETSDGGNLAVIHAYKYKKAPKTEARPFYLEYTDDNEIRNICNKYGVCVITETPKAVEAQQLLDKLIEEKKVTNLISTDALVRLGEEGRVLRQPSLPVQISLNGREVIFGYYRPDPPVPDKPLTRNDVEPIEIPFHRAFQADEVKALLGDLPTYNVENSSWQSFFSYGLLLLVPLILFFVLFRSQGSGPGGAVKFGRSRARLLDPSKNNITFKDVAGISEAKEEVWEIVEFLRNPRKFRNLGGTIPKGVLMVGPPGTGKTLLAKAIAGEADVPFYSISGSDFVEMFVGVGASRVRDMFAEAKKHAPCLIFIDEIDAVGRHRGHGVGGGHDEREQTLNALLVEMDGFSSNENVIVIAATNRVDVLDPALLRPGRFDRRVTVNLPDAAGREQILRVHARKIKLSPDVDLRPLARATTGFSGAELANIVNEAALIAAKNNQPNVTQADLEEAREKVHWGRERRSLEVSDREKRCTAVHEAGHAICLLKTNLAKTLPLHKVTIIPRGPALGVTMMLPEEDRLSEYKSDMLDYIVMAMGGRCAEEVVFGDITGGARADIRQATATARKMVCVYGMSEKLGPVEYGSNHEEVFLARDMSQSVRNFSEHTAQLIDEEIKRIVEENYRRALTILTENKDRLLLITDKLLEYETLSGEQIRELLETGVMTDPPRKELPPDLPTAPSANAPATQNEAPESTDEVEDTPPPSLF